MAPVIAADQVDQWPLDDGGPFDKDIPSFLEPHEGVIDPQAPVLARGLAGEVHPSATTPVSVQPSLLWRVLRR